MHFMGMNMDICVGVLYYLCKNLIDCDETVFCLIKNENKSLIEKIPFLKVF